MNGRNGETRKIVIRTSYWAKPIPLRMFDWEAVEDDYDLGSPIGHGATEADAIADLKQQIEDRENDDQQRFEYEMGQRP